jgi:hypothetical protein
MDPHDHNRLTNAEILFLSHDRHAAISATGTRAQSISTTLPSCSTLRTTLDCFSTRDGLGGSAWISGFDRVVQTSKRTSIVDPYDCT